MDAAILKYVKLVEFLGMALGPNYEISLHDLENSPNSVVAIANGTISGRSTGAPPTEMTLSLIAQKVHKDNDYVVNLKGVSKSGQNLRSSTMFIKEGGELIGLLCVTCNVGRYEQISREILELCNQPFSLAGSSDTKEIELVAGDRIETYANSVTEMTADILGAVAVELGAPVDRFSYEDKLKAVARLKNNGIFLLKGAVGEVARQMNSSEASVYRYLRQTTDGGQK